MAGIKEALGAIDVLNQASPATLASLTPVASLKRLAKGEHLFWDKEQVDHLYFTVEGHLSLYKLDGAGEKRVIFAYGPGQMLNEVIGANLPAAINCEALSEAQVLRFPKNAFLAAMSEDFRLTMALMDAMTTKIRRLYRQMKNVSGAVRGDRRIAAKLWKLSRDYGQACPEGTRITFALTVTYLAEMIGAKRETASRQIKALLAEGLVLRHKNSFIIPDRERLRNFFKEA